MNLKYSGLLFVLTVILEAINGLALDKTSSPNIHTVDLPAAYSATEKGLSENVSATAESVKIIIPNTSEVITVRNSPNNSASTTPQPIKTRTSIPTVASITAPTPAPTPAPAPGQEYWVVRDNDKKTVCIIAEMTMQLNITHPGMGNKSQNSEVINIPKNAKATGSCTGLQNLNIIWGPGHSLQINFSSNDSMNSFFISGMSLKVNATVFKVNKTLCFVNESSEFTTPLDMSYKCSKAQDINLKSESKEDQDWKAVLTLKDTQFQAYMNETKVKFGAAQDCDTFDTPDIVPIAVGCALAILVIVVLVAYLIGRKRSLNRGYLSM